jgi:molecular chaperone GrpE
MTHKHDKNDEEEIVFEDEEDTENPKLALKKLRDKLKQSQTERQEFLEMSQRLKADYVNLKRDEAKLREQAQKYAKQDLLLELVDVADGFEMAMSNKVAWEAVSSNWRQGIEFLYTKLQNVLKTHEVEVIDPLGQPFDPSRHDSMATLDTDNPDQDNMVLEVVQKGYQLHDKVIRPARVKVGHYQTN